MGSSGWLRLRIQPIRHVPNSHIISDEITITRVIDNGIHARSECKFGGPSFAKELSVEMTPLPST